MFDVGKLSVAPFINTWLIAGPFDESVADKIYEKYELQNQNGEVYTPVILPKIGEVFGETTENRVWEYFDDRIYNRNYDDYQDLYGYYNLKKGVSTRTVEEKGNTTNGKYVYTHSYVHSPIQQQVQFRVGTTGKHKVFVNDVLVIDDTQEVGEVKKDMVSKTICLQPGWNRVLVQIKHEKVSFLGFYGRVCDQDGNEVGNLTYSVTGNTDTLQIDTQQLAAKDLRECGMGLPTNVLPYGYIQWPYVWNKSHYNTPHGIGASQFRFMASGGAPGYTWRVTNGQLPDGLSLQEDGTIDGFCNTIGTYQFELSVMDQTGEVARKDFVIKVKENPTKWFEEGRVSALSHCIPVYKWFVDPNYSADLWAERAKRQGHAMVSIESLQQNYYWPSKFEDTEHERSKYLPRDEEGKVLDGLKDFEEAVKRYGMKFGLYYATEGGGMQHFSTDILLQNIEDLMHRYQPDYLYFDGPQAMPWANYDVMFSNIRNYSDEILINSNSNHEWGGEFGDSDLRTTEAGHLFGGETGTNFTKRTINEPWKSQVTKNNGTPYYGQRDDFRLLVKEMVMNIGKGFVDNVDQMVTMNRGSNWDDPSMITEVYPKQVQEFIDVREGIAKWFAPEGRPDRHESTTGTKPYFLESTTCECIDDGKGNIVHFENNHGVEWGYATARDNQIYLHILEGCGGKVGYHKDTLTIGPVKDKVQCVTYLNEDQILPFTQEGDVVTIDLKGITKDPVDTIIKLVTDCAKREYKLTHVATSAAQMTDHTLKMNVDAYMTYPALKVSGSIGFTSSNEQVATVDANGVVEGIADGTAVIQTQVTYEGTTVEDQLAVKVKSGKLYVVEEMIGATLHVQDREVYGQCSSRQPIAYKVEGRSRKGGAIGLVDAEIKMKAGLVTPSESRKHPVNIQESNIVNFTPDVVIPNTVTEITKIAIWGEVTLEGQQFVTNKVFIDLYPTENLSPYAVVTASNYIGNYSPDKVTDGKLILSDGTDEAKWSVDGKGESWVAFAFEQEVEIREIEIYFNCLNQKYYNTPKCMAIQVSKDSQVWETILHLETLPEHEKEACYFGFSDNFVLGEKCMTHYVRLLFPEGSQSEQLELLEVKVNGVKDNREV